MHINDRPPHSDIVFVVLFPRSSKCIDQTFFSFSFSRDVLRFFSWLIFLQFAVVRYLVLWPLFCVSESRSTIVSTECDEFRKHEFVCAHCDRAILNNNTNNEAKRFNIEIAHVSTESRFEDEKQQISCFHSASCFS